MQNTPKSLRLHIGLFGRRNAGKSSLLNALTRQAVSIVSDTAGTTTDPVEKPMELLPLGPVLFIDTAGIDDEGALGELRIEKTRQVIRRTDVGLIVAMAGEWTEFEARLLEELRGRDVPVGVIWNQTDRGSPDPEQVAALEAEGMRQVRTVATEGTGVAEVRQLLLDAAPEDFINEPALLGDLVPPGRMAVLVVPIDMEAPKGRLILPQVQAIRDLLDHDAYCMVVKERELRPALESLKEPPALVVTDSQAFLKVAADVPPSIPLTGFSVLFARYKGDLNAFVRGAMTIGTLKAGDKILMCESCTHHPIGDDIGRVKIPRWVRQFVGGALDFVHVQGHDFPADLASYALVIHCGSCMHNRRAMLGKILECRRQGVPITNYGLAIAFSLGIFERALEPFPAALAVYREMRNQA